MHYKMGASGLRGRVHIPRAALPTKSVWSFPRAANPTGWGRSQGCVSGLRLVPALPFTPYVTLGQFPNWQSEGWMSKSPVNFDLLGFPIARCMLGNQLTILVRTNNAGSLLPLHAIIWFTLFFKKQCTSFLAILSLKYLLNLFFE